MQYAKKLALVDPKFLNQLQTDREYKQIQKPADALAKTSLSLDIGRILRDDTTPDDTKAKLYADALRRYHNIRSHIPTEVKTELPPPPATPPLPVWLAVPPVLTPPPPPPPPAPWPQTPTPEVKTSRPTRERRPPRSNFPWVTY